MLTYRSSDDNFFSIEKAKNHGELSEDANGNLIFKDPKGNERKSASFTLPAKTLTDISSCNVSYERGSRGDINRDGPARDVQSALPTSRIIMMVLIKRQSMIAVMVVGNTIGLVTTQIKPTGARLGKTGLTSCISTTSQSHPRSVSGLRHLDT